MAAAIALGASQFVAKKIGGAIDRAAGLLPVWMPALLTTRSVAAAECQTCDIGCAESGFPPESLDAWFAGIDAPLEVALQVQAQAVVPASPLGSGCAAAPFGGARIWVDVEDYEDFHDSTKLLSTGDGTVEAGTQYEHAGPVHAFSADACIQAHAFSAELGTQTVCTQSCFPGAASQCEAPVVEQTPVGSHRDAAGEVSSLVSSLPVFAARGSQLSRRSVRSRATQVNGDLEIMDAISAAVWADFEAGIF